MRSLYISFSATKRFDEASYLLKKVVRTAILATLDYEQFPYDAEVSVTFCDNEYIKDLNNEFRGIDRATDVLSFPIYDGGEFDEAECATGPDFDGHQVDWDLAVKRNQMYREFEMHKHEETCNLYKKEVK